MKRRTSELHRIKQNNPDAFREFSFGVTMFALNLLNLMVVIALVVLLASDTQPVR